MLDVTRNNAKYRLHEERVIDTLLLFDRSFHNARGTQVSLSKLCRFWGKALAGEGASFGVQWHLNDPVIRARLVNYNVWNLIDSILLALFSGAIDGLLTRDQNPPGGCALPFGRSWDGTDFSEEMNPAGFARFVKNRPLNGVACPLLLG